jgi:hypothetical protein
MKGLRRADGSRHLLAASIEDPTPAHTRATSRCQTTLNQSIGDSANRRVDQSHHHLTKVDDEIIAEIRRSRFLAADFTCKPDGVRGGVYFEAGFAMGLNIPVIWTCKETSMKDLHFDTRQYPHIVWENSADLYKKLKDRIGALALIGAGPKRRK